ncbi:MAG: uridylate kinase [Methanomicrobiaceae archaeon]|uniref:Delta 1-pyrroline-5-carboxylate synthetase n=1 Tax=hydrocarbon metagenome TaxID=938273 RepID=A0A0W8FEU9_9ZZZZ|nr:uridylate kinase [Methanomicrobiaceae archaeon]
MSPAPAPLVIKVGGSLFDRAASIAVIIRESRRPVLIVPGGGRFADRVRRLNLSEDAAHWMAIAAMEQYGWYIASHGIRETGAVAIPGEPRVLLPYCFMRRVDPLPHSWDVTSDTIAAWIADRLGTDLVLLKSVDGIYRHRVLQEQVDRPCPCSEVDPLLIPFVLEHNVRTTVINGRVPARISQLLKGLPVMGTVIDTRF